MAQIAPKQVQSASSKPGTEGLSQGNGPLLFDKTNYILMLTGVLLIVAGFILMSGGGSADPNVFDANEVYSARRITIAPILILSGFIVEIVAVLKKPSERAAS